MRLLCIRLMVSASRPAAGSKRDRRVGAAGILSADRRIVCRTVTTKSDPGSERRAMSRFSLVIP